MEGCFVGKRHSENPYSVRILKIIEKDFIPDWAPLSPAEDEPSERGRFVFGK